MAATPIPLTAGFEHRASAETRARAWALAEIDPGLQPVEAECRLAADGAESETCPGVVLVHGRFPLAVAVLEDSVFIVVDAELVEGRPGPRFDTVRRHVEHFADLGYEEMFDHGRGCVVAVRDVLPHLVADLARASGSRRFQGIARDARLGFVLGALIVVIFDQLFRTAMGAPRSWAMSLAFAVVLGLVLSGWQYRHARAALDAKIRRLREEIVSGGPAPTARFVFRMRRRRFWLEAIPTAVVGGFALFGAIAGSMLAVIVFGVVFASTLAQIILARRAFVVMDESGIEGLGVRGRRHLAYADIDEVRVRLDWWKIGAGGAAIWCSGSLEHSEQMLDVLWDRIDRVLADVAAAWPAGADDDLDRIERRIAAERARPRMVRWQGARPPRPLWMWVRGLRHPLRRQYRWQQHLLTRGRVAWARVVAGANQIYEKPTGESIDVPAVVIMVRDASPATTILEIEAMLSERSAEFERVLQALVTDGAFPLGVELPLELNRGRHAYCTSLVVARRALPLGHVRSLWLPLLIDPEVCPYAMVVPLPCWPRGLRRRWSAGQLNV